MKSVCFIAVLFLVSSCLKLDTNLYNTTDKISEYKLDNYSGEQDFILDDTYTIPSDKITLFSLASQSENESSATAIKALYIGDLNRINMDTVILYCHGNKWHMDFYWQRAKILAHINGKNNYGVMMMDYRGFGLSSGKPTEEGMYADVDACMKWLKEKGLTSERLIIYGFSLGSASATELSANPKTLTPSKLILEAPFASAAVMVQDASQLNMPADYFTDLKIDNAEEIKKVSQPFLWMHGTMDNFLNYKTHGEVVYKNYAGSYKEKFLVDVADHGEIPVKMGFELYLKTIGEFIRK
ncbi:alpha/beta hydrolase [Aurantibacillus circumpalustris]|uniref:alpha/beta hydrolase n=1 Tax=Aurantibacillus circumpalustris TaxID=3036359 RepID=UPI00295BA38D|nr:alpha/beta hydrolase [Aurantibacillus circumpalustris]